VRAGWSGCSAQSSLYGLSLQAATCPVLLRQRPGSARGNRAHPPQLRSQLRQHLPRLVQQFDQNDGRRSHRRRLSRVFAAARPDHDPATRPVHRQRRLLQRHPGAEIHWLAAQRILHVPRRRLREDQHHDLVLGPLTNLPAVIELLDSAEPIARTHAWARSAILAWASRSRTSGPRVPVWTARSAP